MLKEIGLASGLLSSVFDKLKSEKDKDTTGAESFAAALGNGMGISLNTFDSPLAGATQESAALSIGPTADDKMDPGVKEALEMLREMTSGGLEGAMRWAMKELREDVMESMGVSEDELAAMPADQKAATEKMIAEEVQKRLAEAMGKDKQGVADAAMTPEELIAGLQKALQGEANKAYKEDVPTV
jgi:hypothetical protein